MLSRDFTTTLLWHDLTPQTLWVDHHCFLRKFSPHTESQRSAQSEHLSTTLLSPHNFTSTSTSINTSVSITSKLLLRVRLSESKGTKSKSPRVSPRKAGKRFHSLANLQPQTTSHGWLYA
ncbi:unnamed protein product [Ectocarpus sp. 12 AP-2014]